MKGGRIRGGSGGQVPYDILKQKKTRTGVGEHMNKDYGVLSKKKEFEVQKEIVLDRLDNLLPELMKETDIDCWIVACREYNEDPVFGSLMPPKILNARRLSVLVFTLQDGKFERAHAFPYDIGPFYKGIAKKREDPFRAVSNYLANQNIERIGINISQDFAFADGLSKGLHERLLKAFSPQLREKLVPAEDLCIRWLETRTDREFELYHRINAIAHGIINETFSKEVCYPEITTNSDLEWYMIERMTDLGLPFWFSPDVYIHRGQGFTDGVIKRGDILHCDMGFHYFGLASDTQRLAYILKNDEQETPDYLKAAFQKGNEFQDIVASNFVTGKTGNEVLRQSVEEAKVRNLNPNLYTHPIGIHGHGAGPTIGLYERKEEIPVQGDRKIHPNTCYALELNVQIPLSEWNNQKCGIYLEETIGFDGQKIIYFDGRQTAFIEID